MLALRFLIISLGLLSMSESFAKTWAFRINDVKQVTPQVDRLYGSDRNPFATLFCRTDAAEVMFVDSRVADLDGISFYFKSPKACYDAKALIRTSYRNCLTELLLKTHTLEAEVVSSRCR